LGTVACGFCPFLQYGTILPFFYVETFKTMYALTKLAPKKFRKLPSDARFCAKRFRHIDFWTFFLSIF
jgi:hypothetical protein